MTQTEDQLQEQVAQYLRLLYPGVLFHSDFGSGVKLTPWQAAKQKRQNGGRRAWPDMFIANGRIGMVKIGPYAPIYDEKGDIESIRVDPMMPETLRLGLFLELKREGTRLKKKNGEWATPHIAEQAKVLEQLRQRGYAAEFAVGFDEAKKIIDNYLKR